MLAALSAAVPAVDAKRAGPAENGGVLWTISKVDATFRALLGRIAKDAIAARGSNALTTVRRTSTTLEAILTLCAKAARIAEMKWDPVSACIGGSVVASRSPVSTNRIDELIRGRVI